MEISSFINTYLPPTANTSLQELKPMKAPACDQDVQRFESIIAGKGPYQPRSLDLIMPATEPNAIQTMGHNLLDRVSRLKRSADSRFKRIESFIENPPVITDPGVALTLQWELSMFSIETAMITKAGNKAADGIKTLFKNQ